MNENPVKEIVTFHGITIPLPEELMIICEEDPSLIYNLKDLLRSVQLYLAKSSTQSLRKLIKDLRHLTNLYPDLKGVFLDFVVDNAQTANLNGNLKTTILLQWVEHNEEIIAAQNVIEEASSPNVTRILIDEVREKIGKLKGLFRINHA